MITLCKHRGLSETNWLKSFHTFSFGEYYDPNAMGFGDLRVINEDTVQPGFGFNPHAHKNMEIISFVIQGQLAHRDSMGTGSIIMPGEIQRMSAGSGVQHSEFNQSKTELLHFLQIWIIPEEENIQPSYEQKIIPAIKDRLILIGAREPDQNAIRIHQDVKLYFASLTTGNSLKHHVDDNRQAWLQMISGQIYLNDEKIFAGDGAAIIDEKAINIVAERDATFLLFDLKK